MLKRAHRRLGSRGVFVVAVIAVASVILAGAAIWEGRSQDGAFPRFAPADPGPIHVHGLGVDPADQALFIATHTGLYRVEQGRRNAARVGARFQDTMGFAVLGPNRFVGSGHPDLNEARERNLPPLLGLIESTDAGETWRSVSLLGKADFHVLRYARNRVYGYDATNDRLLMSLDRGRTWKRLRQPGPVVDLAVHPRDERRLIAAVQGDLAQGLYESRDGGQRWNRVNEALGLLAWPAPQRLYLVTGGGLVFSSPDGGRQLEHRGDIGGEPAALLATSGDLYAAIHDGTIKRSRDGGATWAVRSKPSA